MSRIVRPNSRSGLSRRTFLRGVVLGHAVSLAMPTLDIMLDSTGTAFADGTQLPQRFVLWFWGNGAVTNRWVPQGTGTGYTLSDELKPFANVKDYLSVISGTTQNSGYAHYGGAGFILTGDYPDGLDTVIGGAARRPSVDQLIAQSIGGSTPFKSLQVGIAYYSHGGPNSNLMVDNISHAGAGTALRAEQNPTAVFDRLFGASFTPPAASAQPSGPTPRDIARGRLLDAVKADAARLRARLGKGDQDRLEAHLSAISDLQKRLAPAQRPVVASECKKPDLGAFSNYTEKTNVMNEVVRLALACDLTRVVSYMFTSPASHRDYPEIGINTSFHANVCHQEPAPQETYHKGVTFFMARFASLLEAVKKTPEGAGNMLDNMCVMGTSCIATQTSGGAHSNFDWPLLVAGRAGGKLKPGMHYRSTSSELAGNVSLTCMKAMGLPATEFGVGGAYTNKTVPILT